jgi:6-pyruvoyl-tetrahydropterin synthase
MAKVIVGAKKLNRYSMVVDFTVVKNALRKYDHTFLGIPQGGGWALLADGISMDRKTELVVHHPHIEPSTAENFASILVEEIECAVIVSNPTAHVISVSLWETSNNKVTVFSDWANEEDYLDAVIQEEVADVG